MRTEDSRSKLCSTVRQHVARITPLKKDAFFKSSPQMGRAAQGHRTIGSKGFYRSATVRSLRPSLTSTAADKKSPGHDPRRAQSAAATTTPLSKDMRRRWNGSSNSKLFAFHFPEPIYLKEHFVLRGGKNEVREATQASVTFGRTTALLGPRAPRSNWRSHCCLSVKPAVPLFSHHTRFNIMRGLARLAVALGLFGSLATAQTTDPWSGVGSASFYWHNRCKSGSFCAACGSFKLDRGPWPPS